MSLLDTINAIGLLSARPAAAAANEGYNYHATDDGITYRSNGSSWDDISVNVDGHAELDHTGLPGVDGGAAAAFSDFTPALTAISVNPTLGSGSVALGRYAEIGDLVVGQAIIQFGTSGVAGGTGSYRVSLPVNARAPGGSNLIIGHGRLTDDSAAAHRSVELLYISATTATLFVTDGSLTVNPTVPWTWAASDYIVYSFEYEAA